MADWIDAKNIISELSKQYRYEWGKATQKMLALAFLKIGYKEEDIKEHASQDVDIIAINCDTGEQYAIEAKASTKREIVLRQKDVDDLNFAEESGFQTFFAVLSLPICISEGWVIARAPGIRRGNHNITSFSRKRNGELSEKVNEVFPDVV